MQAIIPHGPCRNPCTARRFPYRVIRGSGYVADGIFPLLLMINFCTVRNGPFRGKHHYSSMTSEGTQVYTVQYCSRWKWEYSKVLVLYSIHFCERTNIYTAGSNTTSGEFIYYWTAVGYYCTLPRHTCLANSQYCRS